MTPPSDDADSVGRLLRTAVPLPEDSDGYITRAEFVRELTHFEKTIDQSLQLEVTKVQRWIFGGVLAFLVTFGGGGVAAYTSIITKLSSVEVIAKETTRANDRLDNRSQWIVAKDHRDQGQDEALRRLDPSYRPAAVPELPQ